jgi:predicted DNA-binding mobile mystery protein A
MIDRMNTKALARRSLDRRLAPLRSSDAVARPPRGWVRAIRDALGMTTRQLAKRIGVVQSTVAALEKGEMEDTVTLATMRKAAEAMDCAFVYALIPSKPLEEVLRGRARKIADEQLARMDHTMSLEGQALASEDLAAERERLVDELLRGDLRQLWGSP